VAGSDTAGTITLVTAALSDPRSNSDLVQLTFAMPYAQPPIVLVLPANDAAWSLHFGRFLRHGHAASVRLRQADVTTTGFPLRSGVTSLPRKGDVYQFNYLCIGV
jgi:hypothetical protein